MKHLSVLLCLLFLATMGTAQSWQYVNNGMNAQYAYDVAFNGPYVFLGTINGIYRSSNHGDVWTRTPSNNFFTHGLEVIDGAVYAMTTGTLFRSINNGTTWEPILDQQVRAIVKINNVLFVAGGFGILKSVNDGATWTTSNGAIYSDGSNGKLTNTNCHTLAFLGSDMYTGTFGGENGGIFISRDFGAHWMLWEDNGKKYVWDMLATGNAVFASVSKEIGTMGILRCTNRVNWDSKNIGVDNPYIISFGAYGATVYAGNLANTPNGNVGGPYRSGNNGDTWQLFNQGLTSADIYGIGCDGAYIYVANWDKGVARFPYVPMTTVGSLKLTLNAADPWGLLGANSRVKLYNRDFALVGEKWVENANSVVMFTDLAPAAGPYQYEVFNTRTNPWGEVYCGWKGGITVVAGTQTVDAFKHNTPVMPAARVYINSPNQLLPDGARINVPAGTLMRVEIDLMIGNYAGADNSQSWSSIYLDRDMERTTTPPYKYDVEEISPTVSVMKGTTRTTSIFFVIPANGAGAYYLSCGTSTQYTNGPLLTDGGGWIDPAFTIVGTTEVAGTTPEKFAVLQNFPNPFNPTTTIEYSIKQSGPVQLKVVDILGRETTLVDEIQSVGTYRRVWTSQGSGTYFAVLQSPEQRKVIQMSAIK